ncbi:MAG: hypothetical protein ABL957_08300 [Parvularculaceae bacterium]
MIDLLHSARARGEAAVRRAVWALAGAGLLVTAAAFVAAGLVAALNLVIPLWAAFAAAASLLLFTAAICVARSRAPNTSQNSGYNVGENAGVEGSPSGAGAPNGAAHGDWQSLLNDALIRESRDKPARAAAIAAIAGLILGAIEGLDDHRPAP